MAKYTRAARTPPSGVKKERCKAMRNVTTKSSYKEYHLEPDGSLKYVRTVEYTRREEVAPINRTRVFAQTERMIASANAKQLAEAEAFENWVDRASDAANCDWEG